MTWIIDILILVARGFGLLPRERRPRPKSTVANQSSASQFFPFADRYKRPPAAQSHSPSRRGYVPPWAEPLDKE